MSLRTVMMTDPTPPTRAARFWLPLPSRPVYVLSTDHYPWSEVCHDLEQRPRLSAVLEVRQDGRQGRLLLSGGVVLGCFDQKNDLGQPEFMRAFPRATLQLSLLEPALVSLAWQCRAAQPKRLPQAWPEAQDELSSTGFSGVLLGGDRGGEISYWQAGRAVAGKLPGVGAVYGLSVPQQLSAAALVSFWSQVLGLAARQAHNLAELWSSSAADLAGQYPCLDPFAREVWLEQLTLRALPDLNVVELREALLAVFEATLRRARVRLRGLPLGDLQASPIWSASGAGDLV